MKEKISQSEVLAWLKEKHPELHAKSGLDRNWVWVAYDLRGDQNKATRESIKEFGFRFAKKGHALENGKIAMWGHCCDRPMPFKRKGGGGKVGPKGEQADGGFTAAELAEAAALFGS